jgi:hypothetical protein
MLLETSRHWLSSKISKKSFLKMAVIFKMVALAFKIAAIGQF